MPDPMLEKLAKVLVEYSLEVKSGDLMRIRGSDINVPLAREVYRLAVNKGAHPFLELAPEGFSEIFFKEAPEESLDWVSPVAEFVVENIDVDLAFFGSENSYSLAGVDPARQARFQKARRGLADRYMERSFTGEVESRLRWCGTLMPNNSHAQNARMSLTDYADFVYHAMRLDSDDPVAEWRKVSELQAKYVDYLTPKSEIRIVAEDTDLTLKTTGRTWINADGKLNFPDGEVFTGPLETSANGHIRYQFPTIVQGRGAEDVHLWFEDGVVVRWEAREGKSLLDELFAMDDGARRIGEFAIGTNYNIPKFTKDILFDEKIGGTCHIAVGHSILGTGGENESALHWDMICDLRNGGQISADGEVFHDNGEWRI